MKIPIPAAILAIAITTDLAMASSNFNTISHDGWKFRISTPWGLDDHNHQVISSNQGHPVRFGTQSERFDVRPGDCGTVYTGSYSDCENDRERAQMSSVYHDHQRHVSGDEYWYRLSLFIPKDHQNLWKVKVSYLEFKSRACGSIFHFLETKMKSNKGEFMAHFPHSDKLNSATDKWLRPYYIMTTDYINKWMDYVINVKWSHLNDGHLRVWLNGELKLDYKGQTMYCNEKVHFKYGIYRVFVSRNFNSTKTNTIAYYDGIRISRTRDGMFEPLDE